MSILNGFTAFNFEEGSPYVSITKNGMTFNKAVIMKLRFPRHVVLLINEQEKMIAIKPCDEFTQNHTDFYKGNTKILSVRWNAKDLLNTMQEITGWDLSKEAYRVNGTLLKEEDAMLFDLNSAISLN